MISAYVITTWPNLIFTFIAGMLLGYVIRDIKCFKDHRFNKQNES